MSPAAVHRRSPHTPTEWEWVCLIDTQLGNRSVRHAVTFGHIGAGLRRLAKLGPGDTEEISLNEALLTGAALEAWLAANDHRK